jgi:prolipoprotein diacylglyceryltransferase
MTTIIFLFAFIYTFFVCSLVALRDKKYTDSEVERSFIVGVVMSVIGVVVYFIVTK